MKERRAQDPRPDAELVQAIRSGEGPQDAATELFGRYRERVYVWCRRYVTDPEQALDLAQEVLMTAYRSLDTWEGRAPFGGWLFSVTHHACLRAVRRRALVRDEDFELESLPDPRPDAATMLEDEQQRAELQEIVRRHLDPLEQRAMWLRFVERMPVDEITRVLQLGSASGARGLLQTARRKLRAAGTAHDRRRDRGASAPRARREDA